MLGTALASCSRNCPALHEISFTCLTIPVRGAVKLLPFSNALIATQVHLAPCGIPACLSHDRPFSALEGWLWTVSLAPKNVGAAGGAALPDETPRATGARGGT